MYVYIDIHVYIYIYMYRLYTHMCVPTKSPLPKPWGSWSKPAVFRGPQSIHGILGSIFNG